MVPLLKSGTDAVPVRDDAERYLRCLILPGVAHLLSFRQSAMVKMDSGVKRSLPHFRTVKKCKKQETVLSNLCVIIIQTLLHVTK